MMYGGRPVGKVHEQRWEELKEEAIIIHNGKMDWEREIQPLLILEFIVE